MKEAKFSNGEVAVLNEVDVTIERSFWAENMKTFTYEIKDHQGRYYFEHELEKTNRQTVVLDFF